MSWKVSLSSFLIIDIFNYISFSLSSKSLGPSTNFRRGPLISRSRPSILSNSPARSLRVCNRIHANHKLSVTNVSGILTAQYTHKCPETIGPPTVWTSHWNKGMENKAATNVPGRKMTVTAARVFIAVESCLVAAARVRESWATDMLSRVSCWAIKLKS